MPDYPKCSHRVDTDEIETNMRGLIKKRIKPEAQVAISTACDMIFDECLEKLKRVSYLIEQMRDGLTK
jgi:hypothetical protein